MLPEEELWRVVPTNHNYAVSNFGRVKRITRRSGTQVGKILRDWHNEHSSRYKVVTLRDSSGAKTIRVHSLVAEAFLPTKTPGLQVNHKNGNRLDNRVCNLEYVTPKENTNHSIRLGLKKDISGERNFNNKLSEIQVREIFFLSHQGVTQTDLAKRFGVVPQTISKIKTGLRWKHLNSVSVSACK